MLKLPTSHSYTTLSYSVWTDFFLNVAPRITKKAIGNGSSNFELRSSDEDEPEISSTLQTSTSRQREEFEPQEI
ncbi:hypothetical protein TNCV_1140611 [Trichonephila clavipes]|nr:hypothetical protein TNCV_1140611 [Trichonephila clavipes]